MVLFKVNFVAFVIFFCSAVASPLAGDDLREHLKELKGIMTDLRDKVDSLETRIKTVEERSENVGFDRNKLNDVVRRSKRALGLNRTSSSWIPFPPARLPYPWYAPVCKEGKPGRDGRDGRDGQAGRAGPPGKDGLSSGDLERVLKSVLNYTHKALPPVPSPSSRNDTGALYVRWGRTTCPAHSQLVYDGYVAGSHYSHKGGGSTMLCLPKVPQFEKTSPGFQSGGHIYGAEFEVNVFNPFSLKNTRGHSLHDSNAVCAVCLALSRPSLVMIPARKSCPAGWTNEYYGYLMSAHYTHHKNSYDCVDTAPEVNDSGHGNQNGALWYIVESVCGGALPCPPYKNGAELTCVVCTK